MIFSKTVVLKLKSFSFTLLATTAALSVLSGCVKPRNHDSKIDGAASFYIEKMSDPAVDTETTVPGYSIPLVKLYTFTACVKDRRTEESLPGARFKVTGGGQDQEVTTNRDGCLVWSEKIEFDFLANERYLPTDRTIIAMGAQSGARTVKMAINPWKLSDKSEKFKDLDHSSVPAEQMASKDQAAMALKADGGSQLRFLDIDGLSMANTASEPINNLPGRTLKLEFKPQLTLTDILGNPVSVPLTVSTGKLAVSAILIESLTSGGIEKRNVIYQSTEATKVVVEGGRVFATIKVPVAGSDASRFLLAVKVAPVEGPKALGAFEGLFAIGDLKSISETGTMKGDLKESNSDGSFSYEKVAPSTKTQMATKPAQQLPANNANRTEGPALFRMSTLTPTWSGPVNEDVANHRTVMYSVRACFKDLSNGSRPAVNETFTVTLADGKTKKPYTTYVNDDKVACIDWEDTIKHKYYAPEKWFKIPVTITHPSGFKVSSTYAIAPWQAWGFTQDVDAKPGFIDAINNRKAVPSRLIADAVEFNTGMNLRDVYSYEVDDYLSMQLVKRVTVRIPMRAFRPNNIRDGANMTPEAIRTGKYLLKAAFVAPIRGSAENKTQMLISPMRGLTRVIDVRGGEVKAELDFPVSDVRLMSARSYFVFEVKILDEEKLPKNDPYLRNPKLNPEDYVDNETGAVMPTYVAPLFLKNEKDAGVPLPVGDLSLDLPGSDAIDMIGKRGYVPSAVSDAIRPFKNVSVQKLYNMAKKDREDYRARMDLEKSLGLFARRSHAEFVSIYSEPAVVARDEMLKTNNQILPNGGKAINKLIGLLNVPLQNVGSSKATDVYGSSRPQVTQKVLTEFVKGDKPFDLKLATQFCGYFFYYTPRTKLSGVKLMAAVEVDPGSWMDECITKIRNYGPDSVFLRDRRMRAIEVNPIAKKLRPGRSMTFHTGADFTVAKANSRSWGYGASWGSSGLLGSISQLSLMSKLGKKMKAFTAAPGMVGAGIDISTRIDHSSATSTSTGFGSGTNLTMEQNELLIDLKRAETCVVLRPRPEFVESGIRMWGIKKALGAQAGEELMSRGLLICDGYAQPKQVAERYYTFGYAQPANLNLDPNSVDNLPWVLALRGQRDYATFLLTTSASNTTLSQAGRTEIDIGDMPLERLEESYKKYFAGKALSNPGFITTEPKIMRVRNGSTK